MTDSQSPDSPSATEVDAEPATENSDEPKTFQPPEVDPSLLWDITQEEPAEGDTGGAEDEL